MPFLLKTEPSVYSFSDLARDKTTTWDGVTNPQAVKFLREMRPGEELVIYHTGDERVVVGTASVVSVDAKDPKHPVVKIKAGKALHRAVSLPEIKAAKLFADSLLLKIGRLSVVPLTEAQYRSLVG
ncbi:MAG: EVE domain-containing protein [Acidobacteriales bacterium]|nr:EVE domain-containing protein [Terriglobales bacterium]